ncbi:MAG TPA: translocation/assembly module TamB domain-containing protein, partial [Flavobacteriaceae bacterium]|nr:translocation/assembly module TamB domain-containing protein [Flavobacteriaceae bacterium]
GKVVGEDPNFKFLFNGIVDASEEVNYYNFDLEVEHADLNALNFVSRDSLSILKGNISMNMKGTNINDASGSILFTNTSYKNHRETYVFEELEITSTFDERNERTIEVNSPDVISGKVEGKFDLKEIPALFQNAIASLYTNYEPTTITTGQYLNFNFDIYNKIVEVFFPKIHFAPNTFIKGSVESNESEFNLTFKSPKIEAFGNMLKEINFQVDNTNPLFNAFVEIDSVATDVYSLSDFNLINVTLRDTLFVRSEFRGGNNNNDVFNLSLYHTINKESQSVVGIRKSNIKFKESVWYLNEEKNASNRIIFDNNFQDLRLDSLVLSHKNQEIRLSGVKRDSTYKNFKVAFDHVDLEKITPTIDSLELGGTVNGKIHLLQEKGAYFPQASLTIDSISVNEIPYGDLTLNIEGNESLTNYTIAALLKNEKYDFLKADGTINVSGENSNIDLKVALEKFKLSAFSALGGEVITDIRGLASGNATISGNYKNPDIDGKLILENTGLRIPYLNVDFDFKDNATVNLSEQQFLFDNIPIEDTKYHTKGVLNGTISHENFKDWELDLNVDTDRLLVLDTEATETSLYYGTAFISGGASISGPTDELVINVDATTEKGTVFKIPLNDTQTLGDNSFIYFLSPDEKVAKLEGKEIFIKEANGMEINFDLNVTRDALVEIVVDPISGSTLRGRGAGILRIEINTNGKFNMWGDFVVYEGVYNFKYAGLVQKEFIVQSGGSINWSGSPVRADLNVRAIYKTQANPAILLENPSFNRQIPVEVVIILEGQIIQPDITFEIQYPNLSSTVKSELEYRINDEQSTELNALTLVTTGTFYSEQTLRQAPAGNLLEKASSLVSDIFADNGKFNLGLSYEQGNRALDQAAADRFGVTVSTKISKNIIFNGQVGVPIGGVSESLVIGNAEINFLLNEEGTLLFKVFNRENNIRYIGEEIGYSQGLGLSYSVDFDTFEELVRKILNKEIEPEEIVKTIKDLPASVAPDYLKFPEQ